MEFETITSSVQGRLNGQRLSRGGHFDIQATLAKGISKIQETVKGGNIEYSTFIFLLSMCC